MDYTSRIVSAGETSDDPVLEEQSDDDTTLVQRHGPDEFFDAQADDEDEAYVYKHLRSGVQERIPVRQQQSERQQQQQQAIIQAYKPRTSDAVLSCPCCFNIVCMDCQRHCRYENQYRAMFVMGITVHWDQTLRYDAAGQGQLVPITSSLSASQQQQDYEDVYYTVSCANCDTTVAALDMKDEVYHFHGCLASS